MDAKITKKRLSYLLSYDWVKIALSAVAAIIIWSLVFTMTATKITNTQRFVVMNYRGTSISNGMMYKGNSYEVIEAELVDNMRGGNDYFWEIFQANVGVGEGDVLLAANYPSGRTVKTDDNGNEMKDENGNLLYDYEKTYMEDALSSMAAKFTRLDDDGDNAGYFTQMKDYLAKFYTVVSQEQKTYAGATFTVATFDEGTLNAQLVKDEFRARIKANKDKRFKKEEQIQKGELDEIKRIESYLVAYNAFFGHLDAGKVELTYVDIAVTETFSITGVYGVNICPSEQTMGGLKDQFYYTDFENVMTAKDMNALFMDLEGLDKNFQYENILYLNALIEDVYKAS